MALAHWALPIDRGQSAVCNSWEKALSAGDYGVRRQLVVCPIAMCRHDAAETHLNLVAAAVSFDARDGAPAGPNQQPNLVGRDLRGFRLGVAEDTEEC